MKNGVRTTEFWSTVGLHVLNGVIAVAALFGKQLDGSQLQPLIGIAALFASSIAQGVYVIGRSKVKTADAAVVADVNATIAAQTTIPASTPIAPIPVPGTVVTPG